MQSTRWLLYLLCALNAVQTRIRYDFWQSNAVDPSLVHSTELNVRAQSCQLCSASLRYEEEGTHTTDQDSLSCAIISFSFLCASFGWWSIRVSHGLVSFMQDKSWRVRYNVAQQLHILCVALGSESSRYSLHCLGIGDTFGSAMMHITLQAFPASS